MPHKFLEDAATADIAFEARGKTLPELFESAALAVAGAMIEDPGTIRPKKTKSIRLTAENLEMLLFSFLQELLFYKDAQLLVFGSFDFDTLEKRGDQWHIRVKAHGEEIDPRSHALVSDVKAITLHNFEVTETPEGWLASVTLDV